MEVLFNYGREFLNAPFGRAVVGGVAETPSASSVGGALSLIQQPLANS